MNSFEPAPGIIILDEEFNDDERTDVIPKPTPLELKMEAIRRQLQLPLFLYTNRDPEKAIHANECIFIKE